MYRFAEKEEVEGRRWGVYCETEEVQDFGPNVLVPWEGENCGGHEENAALEEKIRNYLP